MKSSSSILTPLRILILYLFLSHLLISSLRYGKLKSLSGSLSVTWLFSLCIESDPLLLLSLLLFEYSCWLASSIILSLFSESLLLPNDSLLYSSSSSNIANSAMVTLFSLGLIRFFSISVNLETFSFEHPNRFNAHC